MVHAFDTGLAKPQRTLIRAAIEAQLADLLKSARVPGYVRSIKHLPKTMRGHSDDDGRAMLLDALQGQAPAIAIALGRKTYDRIGPNTLEVTAEIEIAVYVVSANERGLVEGRLEQDSTAERTLTSDPGIDTMLEHVEERLVGQELGIDTVSALSAVGEEEVATHKDLTIWAQTYRVMVDRTVNPARNVTQKVTSVENRLGLDGVSGDLSDPAEPFVTTVSDIEPDPES